jgi:hypothetical protein
MRHLPENCPMLPPLFNTKRTKFRRCYRKAYSHCGNRVSASNHSGFGTALPPVHSKGHATEQALYLYDIFNCTYLCGS